MDIKNHTPFPIQHFGGKNVRGRDFDVVVARGTFHIVSYDALKPAGQQRPVGFKDLFFGEPGTSSPYAESDIAPFKPCADVLVHAVAHAPGGLATSGWPVRVKVGRLDKALHVTGPRAWEKDAAGAWRLTAPEPCTEVPVRYESAYGGLWKAGAADAAACRSNPVGRGYVPEGREPEESLLAAPQIESPDDPVVEIGRAVRVEGFGPIGRAWAPRYAKCGTFDAAWRAERWPALPLDFDFGYHNCAHPDMIYPGYLRGDEDALLEGLHPDGPLRFRLPGYQLWALLRHDNGVITIMPAWLDTLLIDVPAGVAHLTWRATFRPLGRLRAIEVLGSPVEEVRNGCQ